MKVLQGETALGIGTDNQQSGRFGIAVGGPSPAVPPRSDPSNANIGATTPLDGDDFLVRLRAGDAAAYEALVRHNAPRMLAVARRYLASEPDCEEAVSDAFASAFKAIDRFEGSSTLSTWLHRIVVNVCLMRLRSQRTRRTVSVDELLPTFDETGHRVAPRSWVADPSRRFSSNETRRRVRECIDLLPEAYRTVLILRDIEGCDTATTAGILGTAEGNVKVRLHRARQALRALLEPHFAADVDETD